MPGPFELSFRALAVRADCLLAQIRPLFAPVVPGEGLRTGSAACLLALLAIAALVRFWGIGSYGLHKPDEDTTALPAVHILQDGTPRFPSGMFYARAIVQSYMIAASLEAFGQNEWALRLPSVLCGLVVVGLAFWMGRRFLAPAWNVAFCACVAFLPGMIADSQEARMYIFLVASLVVYTALIFEWERSNARGYLIAAVLAMWVGIQFHQLVIFGCLVVLFPGLARAGDRQKLISGVFALAAIGVGYIVISRVIGSFYPKAATDFPVPISQLQMPLVAPGALLRWSIGGAGSALALGLAWLTTRRMPRGRTAKLAGALVFLAVLSEAALYWHVGLLLLASAVIVLARQGGLSRGTLAALTGSSAILAAIELLLLRSANPGSGRKLVGMLVGEPSVWQYVRIAEYSPAAAAIIVIGLVAAGWRLANRKPISELWLFFLLAAGVPLFVMGVFDWYPPPRYAEFALLPLLLTALGLIEQWMGGGRPPRSVPFGWGAAAVAVVACAIVVNPFAVARAVNAGNTFPDHRGAAAFIRSLPPGPKDILVAEEVLMQTYYLGHIDYWLQGPVSAAGFIVHKNGQFVDEYTDTPVISTGAELRALLDRPDRGAIYIIGSGENQDDGRLSLRGAELSSLLQSDRFQVVYVGPDRLTRIWRAAPPGGAH